MTIFEVDNPVRMVRELKGAPLSIVLVLSLVHQRVTQEYLERATGYTDKPVSQALAYLQEVGLADHTSAGWQLIEQAVKQLPLPLALDEKVQETEKPGDLSRNNSDSNESVVVVVNTDNLNSVNTTTTNLNSGEVGKIPTLEEIQQVLDAAEELFGQRIMGDPRVYADIWLLIAWIDQAYHESIRQDKGKVRSPAGLVYWAFKERKKPLNKYLRNPGETLPESFQEASGQWIFEDEEV